MLAEVGQSIIKFGDVLRKDSFQVIIRKDKI